MNTYKTYLPIFSGFYNTIFEPDESNEIESINYERKVLGLKPIDYNDCQFDYNDYELNVSYSCCNFIEEKLNDLGLNCNIRFEKLVSPKFYNYSNDSINIEIDINLYDVKKYIIENKDEFNVYIKNKYTSCSGFISHYSNNGDEWILNEIDNSINHCLGSTLDFILNNEFNDLEFEMYYNLTDCYLSCTNYNELTTIKN